MKFAKRVDLEHSHSKKKVLCEVTDMLINLIVVIISQCICTAKHHVIHLKYIKFIYVNYTSIKPKTKFRGRQFRVHRVA